MDNKNVMCDLIENTDLMENDMRYVGKVFPNLIFYNVFLAGPALAGPVCSEGFLTMRSSIRRANSIFIKVLYKNYPSQPVEIYDVEKKIDWNVVPLEHWHDNGDGFLCTHHEIELKEKPLCEWTRLQIESALRLFYQVEICKNGGMWTLPDLPHGDAGTRVLEKEKRDKIKQSKKRR